MAGNIQNIMGTDRAQKTNSPSPLSFGEQELSPRIVKRVLDNLQRFSVVSEVQTQPEPERKPRRLSEDDKAFQSLVLTGDYASCVEFIRSRIAGRVTFRRLCLGLMSNAARDLGEQWSRDELSFVDVTVALARLHLLLHDFSKSEPAKLPRKPSSIILANAPTEQHAFGLSVVSKVFEFEGWSVSGGPYLQAGTALEKLVSRNCFDVAGISAATPENAKALEPRIAGLRKASSNPCIKVIVGGGGFAGNPELYRQIGADGVAVDANEAVLTARALLA